jgi:hypothetical protein
MAAAGAMLTAIFSHAADSGLPREKVRSAPAIISGPARSRRRQATLSIESSDSFVASAADSIATGWSEPVPGGELHPLESNAFHGALFQQLPSQMLLTTWVCRWYDDEQPRQTVDKIVLTREPFASVFARL